MIAHDGAGPDGAAHDGIARDGAARDGIAWKKPQRASEVSCEQAVALLEGAIALLDKQGYHMAAVHVSHALEMLTADEPLRSDLS